MDLLALGSTTDLTSPLSTSNTPVFGDNVQDLLNAGAINVNPTGIIVVNSIADTVDDPNSGVTTLRDAINQANADDGEDLIVFERSLFSNPQTITLGGTKLDITHNLDIIAPRDSLTGADLVTVSGNNASRVFEIGIKATVSIDGLIIADGKVNPSGITGGYGGGIYNSGGTITVSNSTLSGNSAAYDGGGIYNNGGTITVSNSTFSGNSVGGDGGGIYNIDGTITVSNSTFSGNSAIFGGGIYNSSFVATVQRSIITGSNNTISGNLAFKGGGIFNSGTITVSNNTISGNRSVSDRVITDGAGGGIYNTYSGTVNLSSSTISDNSAIRNGGGIYNSRGTVNLSSSTISGNSAIQDNIGINGGYGGGIYNDGTVNLSSSTISSNSATNGGGIYNLYPGTLTLLFSTVTQNIAANGGGVYQDDDPSFYTVIRGSNNVRNTIIASNLNSDGGVNPDVTGTFTSSGYNLIGDSTGSTGFDATGDIVGTSDRPIDPRLAPLDFYGGPTQTLALLPDSPAIDAGDPTILDTDPITDQRGLPRVVNGRADIGAFEAQV